MRKTEYDPSKKCHICDGPAYKTDGEGKILCERHAMGLPDPYIRETPKIGRNEPCPCGSGKKHKHCCHV